MSDLKLQALEKRLISKKLPTLRAGYLVRVHQKIKEGEKERIQIFEGMIIGISSGHGPNKTFTVRKVVEGIGVEKIFPLASPNVAKIEVKKTFKVRRAKLGYMRDASSMSTRLKAKLGLIEKDTTHNDKIVGKYGKHVEAAAVEAAPVEETPAEETTAPVENVEEAAVEAKAE